MVVKALISKYEYDPLATSIAGIPMKGGVKPLCQHSV